MPIESINGTAFADIEKFSGVAKADITKLSGSDKPSSSSSIVTDSRVLDWRPGSISGTQVTDGVNDHITVTIDDSDLSSVDYPLTYEAWMYAKGNLSGTSLAQIIHKDYNQNVDWHRMFLDKRSGQNRIVTQKYTITGQRYVWVTNPGFTLQDETWYHVVMTMEVDSNNRNVITQYINGSLNTSATSTYSTGLRVVPWSEGNTETTFSIGSLQQSTTKRYYHGYVGEVRMYSDLLTTSEITNNYNATKSNYGY